MQSSDLSDWYIIPPGLCFIWCESGFSGQTGGLTCIIISCPQSYWICSFANWITVLVVALSAPNTSTFCTFHWLNKFCKFYNFCNFCNFFSFHKNCNLPLPLLFIYLQFFQFFAAAWKPGHMLRNTAPHSFSTQLYKWAPATYCNIKKNNNKKKKKHIAGDNPAME